jgi:hypothetical protein
MRLIVPTIRIVPLVPRFPKTILDCPVCRLCRDYGKPIARDRRELALHHVGDLTPQLDSRYLVEVGLRVGCAYLRSPRCRRRTTMSARTVGQHDGDARMVGARALPGRRAQCSMRSDVPAGAVVQRSRGGVWV